MNIDGLVMIRIDLVDCMVLDLDLLYSDYIDNIEVQRSVCYCAYDIENCHFTIIASIVHLFNLPEMSAFVDFCKNRRAHLQTVADFFGNRCVSVVPY